METREFEENLIRVVAAVIVNNKGERALLGQRAKTAKHPLKWEFIGGKIEFGEDLDEAIEREVYEETGLVVKPIKLLDVNIHDYGGEIGKVQINFVQCQLKIGVATKEKYQKHYQDIRWVAVRQLPELDLIEGDRGFANKLAVDLTTPVPSQN